MQAFTKKPMKPSFTPCFFSNSSLYWLRSAITALMSTSLKVVSMAAVFCASLRRRAMVWRSRVMLHALFARGIVGRRRRAHLHRRGDRRRRAAARSIAASMSPLVTWPCLPVPATLDGSTPLSAATLAHRRRRAACRPARLARRAACVGGADRRGVGLASGGLRGAGGVAGAARRAFLDLAEQRADADGLAVLGRDLAEHAGGRRRHFQRHLVGLEFDQRLVDGDGVARLLEPFADGGFGHRFAEGGHADVSHDRLMSPLATRPR